MGCFSFLCQKCGKGIQSTSFSGQQTILVLLKDGKEIQRMDGEYDSYGRVFIDGSQRSDVKHDLRESVQWKSPVDPNIDPDDAWGDVCDLMFDSNTRNGIAAVHKKCLGPNEEFSPTNRSESDPNQGWGEDDELLGNTDDDFFDEENEEVE